MFDYVLQLIRFIPLLFKMRIGLRMARSDISSEHVLRTSVHFATMLSAKCPYGSECPI